VVCGFRGFIAPLVWIRGASRRRSAGSTAPSSLYFDPFWLRFGGVDLVISIRWAHVRVWWCVDSEGSSHRWCGLGFVGLAVIVPLCW